MVREWTTDDHLGGCIACLRRREVICMNWTIRRRDLRNLSHQRAIGLLHLAALFPRCQACCARPTQPVPATPRATTSSPSSNRCTRRSQALPHIAINRADVSFFPCPDQEGISPHRCCRQLTPGHRSGISYVATLAANGTARHIRFTFPRFSVHLRPEVERALVLVAAAAYIEGWTRSGVLHTH